MLQAKDRKCRCTDTLAKSQPTDSCSGLGYAVYWSQADNQDIVLKVLEKKTNQKALYNAQYMYLFILLIYHLL